MNILLKDGADAGLVVDFYDINNDHCYATPALRDILPLIRVRWQVAGKAFCWKT
jgi:hypothetical protein